MDVQDGNGTAGRESIEAVGPGHRCDGGDAIGALGAEPMRHHRAVRMHGRIDAPLIDSGAAREILHDSDREPDIVDTLVHRVAAALARVPCQQAPAQRAGAVRIHDQDTLAIGDRIEPGVALEPLRLAAAAVKGDHDRQRTTFGDRARRMQDVRTLSPVVVDGERVIARRERRGSPLRANDDWRRPRRHARGRSEHPSAQSGHG